MNNNNSFKKSTPKQKFLFAFKFVRIAIYLFLAAITLTGCIQSFVLKSSSTVGSGIELYNKKSNIAPYVNSYKVSDKEVDDYLYDENGNLQLDENGNIKKQKVKVDSISPLSKENFLLEDNSIEKLRNQINGKYNKELYGTYNNKSSSLRIIGKNGYEISNTNNDLMGSEINDSLVKGTKLNNEFLFMNSSMLDYMNSNGKKYNLINDISEIKFFALKKPKDGSTLTSEQKKMYGEGFLDISSSFQAYEQIGNKYNPVMIENGKYVTYDIDADGVNDTYEKVVIKDQNRINKFKYAFNAEVVTLKKDDINSLFNSELYARDFLQSLVNIKIQFSQLNPFFEWISNGSQLPSTAKEKLSLIERTEFKDKMIEHVNPESFNSSLTIDSNLLLSAKQKNAILVYQNEISSLLSGIGFGIKKQVYDNENDENNVAWETEYEVEFLPNVNDKKNNLIGSAPIEQKPITSWSDAWQLGPFYGLVVWPIAWIINSMVGSMPPMNGWAAIIAIVVAVLSTRILTTLLTYKSIFSQHKQQQIAPKKAKIDAKYEGFKGNKQMENRKRQEISELYKKNGISMLGPLLSILITMPIFLAVWRVTQGIPDLKSASWLGIQFSLVSWRELFSGQWQYLPLLVFAVLIQAVSQLLPRFLNKKRMSERSNVAEKEAMKKANKTQNIIMVVFIVMAVIFEAGVQIYWIVGGLWQIFQTLIVHWIVKTDFYKNKLSKYV